MSNNPLLDFARKPELTVKLPSNGNWYPEGMINYTLNGEVEVFAMTPKDELMMLNPDSLLSGDANIKLIESCVPSVKNAKDLLYPDANTLLLAIHRATYGEEMIINVTCPKCTEKAIQLEDPEKVSEAEKNGEIMIHPQENKLPIDNLLQSISYLDSEYKFNMDNGLTIYFSPTLLKDKLKYGLINFNQQKIAKYYENYDFEEFATQEDKKEVALKIIEAYENITDVGNNLITDSILKIELPDGSYVDDKQMILEFVSKTNTVVIGELHKKIQEINNIGVPSKVSYECQCCGHTWESELAEFNQSDFFGYSS